MFCLLKRKTSKIELWIEKTRRRRILHNKQTNKKSKNKKSIKNKLDSLICHKAFHFSLFSCLFLFNLKLSNKLVLIYSLVFTLSIFREVLFHLKNKTKNSKVYRKKKENIKNIDIFLFNMFCICRLIGVH